jgi:hypothetical protein
MKRNRLVAAVRSIIAMSSNPLARLQEGEEGAHAGEAKDKQPYEQYGDCGIHESAPAALEWAEFTEPRVAWIPTSQGPVDFDLRRHFPVH